MELPKGQKKQLGLPISQLTVSLANALSHSTVANIPWGKKQQVAHIKSLPFIVYLLSVLISNVLCPRSLAVSRALTAACWNKQARKQTLSYYEKKNTIVYILIQMYPHWKKKNGLINLQRAVINIYTFVWAISSFLVHISVYTES